MTATERAAEEAERRVRENDGLTYDMEVDAFVAGAEWHAEQSSTLAVEKVAEVLAPELEDQPAADIMARRLARAIVAEFGPLVSTRERIITALMGEGYGEDREEAQDLAYAILASGAVVEPSTPTVDREAAERVLARVTVTAGECVNALIASGIVRDAREVRAEQIERDAQIAEKAYSGTKAAEYIERGIIAAAIREQKPWA